MCDCTSNKHACVWQNQLQQSPGLVCMHGTLGGGCHLLATHQHPTC